jgi:energy-coupling factor transport system substrate-specific component
MQTWRTRDILVTAIIGVAFGVVFAAWNLVWNVFAPLNAVTPLPNFLLYGMWLMPAVLAPLIVRKPGAALFAEAIAAAVSMFMPGNTWSVDVLLSGVLQGAAAEAVFAIFRYRNWSLPVLSLAAIASSVAAWLHDWALYYADTSVDVQLLRGIVMAVSAVAIVAYGSVLLVGALQRTGVLRGFGAQASGAQGTRA